MDITKVKVFDEINKVMRDDVAAIDFELNRVCFINNENRIGGIEHREFWDAPFKVIHPTGLTDRNGKEIYEGDIVHCKTGYHEYITVVRIGEYYQDSSGNEYPSVKCYGVYGEEAYDTRGGYVQVSSINANESIEVLGNEYEHPHLIEGVK